MIQRTICVLLDGRLKKTVTSLFTYTQHVLEFLSITTRQFSEKIINIEKKKSLTLSADGMITR